MRRLFLTLLLAIGLGVPGLALPTLALAQAKPAPKLEQAIFAGGCFWCMEHDMKAIPGVTAVMSGYTGGTLANPRYEDVVTETTGHYESVRVTYDANKITYAQLLDRYWPLVDPTDDGGQFCDRGPSYRPAVFVTPSQRPIAEASRTKWAAKLKSGMMKAQIVNASRFYWKPEPGDAAMLGAAAAQALTTPQS